MTPTSYLHHVAGAPTTDGPATPWTPGKTCRVLVLPGDSPPTQPRTAPRPQPHQGGFYRLPDDVGAVCAHTCSAPCPPHDPSTAWKPGRACRLPVPGGDSPPPAYYGPQHALNCIRVASPLTLQALCVSPLSVHCCALPATPPRHRHRAGHAGYLYQEEAAHRQPATGCITPSTAPGWLVPPDRAGAVCVHTPCALLYPPHEPTTTWTPGRVCRLSAPG